jgi:uncharacterized protein YbjT (DUF2867 family)
MSILITGGRGKIARAVHAGLTALGLDVRLASREPSESSITLDFTDPTSLTTALKDVTQVFLYADPGSAQSFVTAADNAGVKQVVLLSSMPTHATDAETAGDPHAVAERIIATGSFATTFLQPGTFMSNAIFWSHQIRTLGQVRLRTPHPIEPTVEHLTDHPARPFTTWLQDHPDIFAV